MMGGDNIWKYISKGGIVLKTTADVVAEALKREGIDYVFGFPSGEVTTLMDAFRRAGIKFILTKHETTASFMADAYGEITGKPGVCLATVGPGATNMLTGVANAYLDRAPVIAITGQLPTDIYETAVHQQLDLKSIYRPVTKWCATVNNENAGSVINKAIHIAKAERPGPVYIEFPSNVASQEVKGEVCSAESVKYSLPGIFGSAYQGLNEVVEAVINSKSPIILAGLDAVRSPGADKSLVRLAEKLHIPVVVPPKAKGIIPEDHPLFVGVIEMLGDKVVRDFVHKADLTINIGYDVTELDKPWGMSVKTIHISSVPNTEQFYPAEIEIMGDIKTILDILIEELPEGTKWDQKQIDETKKELYKLITPRVEGLAPYRVVEIIREIAPRETIATADVGAHKFLTGQMWKTYSPKTFFMSNGLSSMGYSFPAAMTAKLLNPERPVIAFVGDGGLGMYLGEIETAVRCSIPVILVVLCDKALSLIKMNQERKGLPVFGTEFTNPDFAKVAEAFGAKGYKVEMENQVRDAIEEALKSDVITLIEAVINAQAYRV